MIDMSEECRMRKRTDLASHGEAGLFDINASACRY